VEPLVAKYGNSCDFILGARDKTAHGKHSWQAGRHAAAAARATRSDLRQPGNEHRPAL